MTDATHGHRRLVPVGVVVLVYVAFGVLWVLAGGPAADAVSEIASIPHWIVDLGRGLLFVAITALALHVLMRRRADRLDAAGARTSRDARRLVASEDRNRLQATALSGSGSAVVITGRDGTIEWVNEAFETMSGYPRSVAVGATLQLVAAPAQDEVAHRDLWATVVTGQVWRGQVVNRRSDGELYTVSQTVTPVVDERDAIQNFVAVQEDISERVRVSQELDTSRLRLQAVFERAIDAIVLADDQGRCIEVNPAVSELTGYSRDELLCMGLADLAVAGQRPGDVANPPHALAHAGTESGTFALQHKDGHITEAEFRTVSDIQPGVHLSVLRDVTERYSMLRALTLAEAEFRELAEDAADIVAKLRVDADGRMQIEYVNPAATVILGHSRERLRESPDLLLDLLDQRSDDLHGTLDLLPTPAEPIRLVTVQVQRADGSLVWLETHATLTDPSTSPVTVQLVARDVTARAEMTQALEQALQDQLQAAEQLRALNAMKDTFLQNISHELRTPLTTILGFSHLLADPRHGLSPGDTREFHRRILANAQRLQRLLDDLLDIDRSTRGDLEPHRLPTELAELIERVVSDLDLGDHAIELDLAPVTMNLDAPRVARIVANLLHNVQRHTPPGTRIWIRTRATPDGVKLTVDDDGPGVPAADRQRVIEPFQQGTEAASSPTPGTGVGLALVDALAHAHGGGLTIADGPSGGTRITITLAHDVTGRSVAAADVAIDVTG